MFKPRRPSGRNDKNYSRPGNKGVKPVVKGPSPIPTKDPNEFPMRINKYLAMKGFATRRDADKLIARKVVTINGRFAVLGDKVTEQDVVDVRKNKLTDDYVYYACHKPRGITTLDTRKGQTGFVHALPVKGLFPIGSLDKEAGGLIIFTNDRRLIDRLENPLHPHAKQYVLESREPLRSNFKEKLEAGVKLDDGSVVQSRVQMKSPTSCLITILDPKNHIRQICSLFGAETSSLTRVSILNIQLGHLPPNGFRKIQDSELDAFLGELGL